MGRDGGLGGRLVLRAGRRGGGDLILLVYLMEAVELRKNQPAVLLVLGSCGLRWLPGACSCGGASGGAWRLRELCCCGLVRGRALPWRARRKVLSRMLIYEQFAMRRQQSKSKNTTRTRSLAADLALGLRPWPRSPGRAADLALGLRPWRPHGCARTAKPGARGGRARNAQHSGAGHTARGRSRTCRQQSVKSA